MKRLPLLFLLSFAFALASLPARPARAQSMSLKPCAFVKISNCDVRTTSTTCPNNTAGRVQDATTLNWYNIRSNGQLEQRRFVTFCFSKHASNPAAALVTLRDDGTTPTTAVTDPGTVLAQGDCISLPISAGVTPKAISTVDHTYLTVLECI